MNQNEKTKIAGALIHAADVLMDADKARANKILRRAIALAKNPMAKEWLRDGKASGTWIRTAADLLERSAAKAAELGLSEADVDDEVAAMMAWMALTAILRDAKKGSGLLTAARSSKNVSEADRQLAEIHKLQERAKHFDNPLEKIALYQKAIDLAQKAGMGAKVTQLEFYIKNLQDFADDLMSREPKNAAERHTKKLMMR